MPDDVVQAESSPAETVPEAPETQTPDSPAIFQDEQKAAPEAEEAEESAPSEDTEPEEGESEPAPEAAKQERPEVETPKAERRIKQLTAQVRALERRLQAPPPQPTGMMQPPVRPKLEEYEDVAKYDADLETWKIEDRKFAIQMHDIERQRSEQQRQMAEQQAELKAVVDKRIEKFQKAHPDFNIVESLQIVEPSPTMDGFMADTEFPAEMVDYFVQNPDEADRIRSLAPFKAVRELVRLEEKISLQAKGIKAKPSTVKPPSAVAGRAAAPAAPKSAADILYG